MYSVRLEPGTRHIRPEAGGRISKSAPEIFSNEIKQRPKGAAKMLMELFDGIQI
jgi:hypothetical protein